MYLHTLGQYLAHFAGRPAVYLEAEAPEPSAKAEAWPRLIAALGLTEPVEVGAAVRFDLPGFGAVEGVVDYVTPHFVGLRAPLALIRFHGRAPIGMTVAVSQHTYCPPSTTPPPSGAGKPGWPACSAIRSPRQPVLLM